ncbi:NAD-dependent protein deacylase [Roseivirga sp. 4D4]|uniref:SIR2 family NAD-dependent protein deacylase n=1 Tax=Roseivirga sp. 4D4 TaxID=1889784 RepID=UPI00085312D2|nr:NAD-dependent deacylase [Roseivirga sp. 4D4]OEK01072.1 NAD-dependent protein deacylase [Roseivirga sp. 4D4]
MQKLVVLTGAGISAESGLKTFRDSNGLWEGHDVMQVASPQGWSSNPELVLEFYNQRRKQAQTAQPNEAHTILAELESHYDVQIITQNVDNLHEKAGSSNVLHLHGELFQSRSTFDENLVYKMDHWELKLGDLCEKGSQLRPNIVWFGEAVPMMEPAVRFSQEADIFLIVGTSLQVYPAASLIDFVKAQSRKYLVDPNPPSYSSDIIFIPENATSGMKKLKNILSDQLGF